jgi:hypothetical protein
MIPWRGFRPAILFLILLFVHLDSPTPLSGQHANHFENRPQHPKAVHNLILSTQQFLPTTKWQNFSPTSSLEHYKNKIDGVEGASKKEKEI